MELNHLRAFYEVAKAGSFTEAARRLRISQSALSKAVRLLEEAEGVQLFERSKRGVALTPLGGDVFLRSERIFAIVSEVEVACRGHREKIEGPLRIGASDHIINYVLSEAVVRMRSAYPRVHPILLSAGPNGVISALLANQIECGFFFGKVVTPGIEYETFSTVEMAVVCHPKFNVSGGLKKILRQTGLISSIGANYNKHPWTEIVKHLSGDLAVMTEASSQEGQKRLCLSGGGIAYLARFMVEEEIKAGKLAEIPMGKPILVNILLARRRGRELPLVARSFLKLLKA